MNCTHELHCLDCNQNFEASPLLVSCPHCGGQWLEAAYPISALAPTLLNQASSRPFDLWRYQEVIPVCHGRPSISMGEGGTPLIHAENLGMMLGLPHLYIKDERQGPTASFKDRQAAVTMALLKEAERTEAVVASTGNVAIAFSAYGARSGVNIWAFLTSRVPASKMREIALYGTQVVKVTSTYDQAKVLAAEFAERRNLYLDRGVCSIAAVEAMKTIAYELAEQLGAGAGGQLPVSETGWRAPDWYFQAVSGGIGPVGVEKGFRELHQARLIEKRPAIGIIQAAGCAPMAQAWKRNASQVTAIDEPSTYISTLSTGDPGRAYQLLRERMLAGGGGLMESVTDEEAFAAMHLLAKMEGLSVEPAAAVAFAGVIKLAQAGKLNEDEIVVVNCSGHTQPVEEELLGEHWTAEIDLEASLPALSVAPEGLLAALTHLDETLTTDVLIVDDHDDARRLIRRILQAQGNFQIHEAKTAAAGLEHCRHNPPDLIILDLMMPVMDGFDMLEALRAQPITRSIPVIVVSAKELSSEEKNQLQGQISKLMMKGDFLNKDLIEEIGRVLE